MKNRNSSVLNMIRGGQTLAHYIGMAKQVAGYIVIFGGAGFLLTFSALLYYRSTFHQFHGWINYAQAALFVEFRGRPTDRIWFIGSDFKSSLVEAYRVYEQPSIAALYQEFNGHLWFSAVASASVLAVIILLCIRFISVKGEEFGSDEMIRGNTCVEEDELKSLVEKRTRGDKRLHPGDISIGSIRLPREWESQNFFMIGGPGSGKTVLFRKWLNQARKSGRRAVVHDRSGTYVERFYREGIDVILNPLDTRTAPWSLFDECQYLHEFEMVAETLFPETQKGDPFWYEAPRLIFVSLAMKEAQKEHPSANWLSRKVLTCELDELIAICKGTFAQSVIDDNVVKQSQTLRSIVATKMRCLTLYDDHLHRGFSLRQWVFNEDSDATIFITSKREMDAYLKPLVTIWLELASSSILSLPETREPKVWLLFDELHALGKIKSLGDSLADIRKHGGCAVLGFQGYAQAKSIYGADGVDSLADNCASYVFLRANNASSAVWMSDQLGKKDAYEAQESLSYGQERVRDGVNMSVNRNAREIVMPTQLQNLPDLRGYLKLGRGLPVASFAERYVEMEVIAKPFIEDTSKLRQTMDSFVRETMATHQTSSEGEPSVHEMVNERDSGHYLTDDLLEPSNAEFLKVFDNSDTFALDDVVTGEDR